MSTHIATRTLATEIIAALMWGPKTTEQLVEFTGAPRQAVVLWLKSFHASGVIRIVDRIQREINPVTGNAYSGARRLQYAIQTEPFALPDAPMPDRKRKKYPISIELVSSSSVVVPARYTAVQRVVRTPASSAESTNPATA